MESIDEKKEEVLETQSISTTNKSLTQNSSDEEKKHLGIGSKEEEEVDTESNWDSANSSLSHSPK